ncbi:hypothetical protein CDL15_Pgr017547 [Punica granatum]|uniref:Uncharacterized protein n=1 Tax=Punica granatum TaxID=22663 RepID=A0A218W643_PUNGR|nr:hypothetical protein CDL15_Pgr017547 [Punica granatum]
MHLRIDTSIKPSLGTGTFHNDENFLASNSRAYGTQVLTTGGAPPVSHTLPIKNGRGKSTRCLRREYTTDAGSFSTAHDERATTTYHCRRATSTSWDSLGPSSTTDFIKHVTTARIRTTTTWALDERATTTYPCRRTTSTSRSSLGPSPTTNFNKHATTWVRAATNDVYAVVGDSSTTACP